MEIRYANAKQFPIRNVLALDPANHTGLISTVSNDEVVWKVFSRRIASLRVSELMEKLSAYRHPKADGKRSGTGVFFVTNDGGVGWTTIYGTTYEMLLAIETIVDRYLVYPPLVFIERPHPQNATLCQTVGCLCGMFLTALGVHPVIATPQRYKEPQRVFRSFLRRHGVVYENPTPHELDATLLVVQTLDDAVSFGGDEDASDETVPIEEFVLDIERLHEPELLSESFRHRRVNESDVHRFVSSVLLAITHRSDRFVSEAKKALRLVL